jgi:hypothetical protein
MTSAARASYIKPEANELSTSIAIASIANAHIDANKRIVERIARQFATNRAGEILSAGTQAG